MSRLIKTTLLILMLVLFTQVASAQQQTHTVNPGETLAKIAVLYNVDMYTIAAANGIQDVNTIYRGQELVIPPQGAAPLQVATTYTVQPGDTMKSIADRFYTTVDALSQANGLANPDYLTRGQVLNLPATGGPVLTTVTTPQVAATPVLPRRVVNGYYTVQQGDTLYAIGQSFNADIWNIARANGILNLNHIYSGQSLRIPGY